MSHHSKGQAPLSREEARLLCELLDRMDAQGRVPGHEELLFTEGMMRAMADSSKLLRSENEDAGFEGYDCVGTPRAKQFHLDGPTGSQAPVPPNSKTGLKLPPGVTDLKDWGTTICKLPKVASLKLSYDDMVMDQESRQLPSLGVGAWSQSWSSLGGSSFASHGHWLWPLAAAAAETWIRDDATVIPSVLKRVAHILTTWTQLRVMLCFLVLRRFVGARAVRTEDESVLQCLWTQRESCGFVVAASPFIFWFCKGNFKAMTCPGIYSKAVWLRQLRLRAKRGFSHWESPSCGLRRVSGWPPVKYNKNIETTWLSWIGMSDLWIRWELDMAWWECRYNVD